MRVAVTGSNGFVGRALVARLETEGHRVLRLVRPGSSPVAGSARWDPRSWAIDAKAVEGLDAVVHLAGAGIGVRPWTRSYKEKILRSRVDGTRLISETLAGLDRPPKVLLSASAIGWYGDRGDEVLTEDSPPGTGFRAGVCREWEAATSAAEMAGIRVVRLRFGIVLGTGGGLLKVLMMPARLGLGTRLGSGRQFVSWISLADAVGAVMHLLAAGGASGPVNVTSPEPVTNREFAAALSRALGRPRIGWAPAWLLKLVAGKERANEVLLSSQRAVPQKLLESGYDFVDPEIGPTLRKCLKFRVSGP
jgi:uncharacterized protein (TIGR01777 family)